MAFRIVRFSLADVAHDPEGVGLALTRASRRDGREYRLAGVFQLPHEVVFPFTANGERHSVRYVVAPFLGPSPEDVIADIASRWGAGFESRGMVRFDDLVLGVFETAADGAPHPDDGGPGPQPHGLALHD